MATLTEFELIETLLCPLADKAPGAFALTDDAALLPELAAGEAYVVTKDALSVGTHMLPDDPPGDMARKALRVNLSDLAAMGARPVGCFMALCLGQDTDDWFLKDFIAGLADDIAEFGVPLMGGDIIRHSGAFTVSLTAFGAVQRDKVLRRNGARAGDSLWVSGTIGDGALGLKALRGEFASLSQGHCDALAQRYRIPQPRVALGASLAGLAAVHVHACIDISDGLVADIGHICETSGVGCRIEAPAVPVSEPAQAALTAEPDLIKTVLTGGDDYELAFAVAPEDDSEIATLEGRHHVALQRIGIFEAGAEVKVVDAQGDTISFSRSGYRHVE